MVSAASIAALESLRELEDADADAEHALAVMDEAFIFLQGGLDALRRTAERRATSDAGSARSTA
jgi:hypothetical protein